jgi:hypothetical protein
MDARNRDGARRRTPDGQARFLDGQGHDVDPAILATMLKEFFV